MYFDTKNYLKSNRYYTAKHTYNNNSSSRKSDKSWH
jgi:hypothetical protein